MTSTQLESPLWHQPCLDYTRLLESANSADPLSHPWGYFAWHCGFACGPVTIGVFMWFETREAMLQALVQAEVRFEHAGEIGLAERAGMLELQQLADQLTAGELSFQAACLALSEPFGFLSLAWMGHFPELLSGNSDFALELRQAHHQAHDRANQQAAIPDAEIEAFIVMIRDWGV